jgi:hypothetical protein
MKVHETTLQGTIRIGGVEGEVYSINEDFFYDDFGDRQTIYQISSTNGYYKEISGLSKAIDFIYKRVTEDKIRDAIAKVPKKRSK